MTAAIVVALAAPGGGSRPRHGSEEPEATLLRGPDVPPAGALPGTLYVTTTSVDCRLLAVALKTVTFGRKGATTNCQLWPAPRGALVLIRKGGHASHFSPKSLWLGKLGDPPQLLRWIGLTHWSDPAWSSDGRLAAWCEPDGNTTVVGLRSRTTSRVRGCSPAFAGTSLVTSLTSPTAQAIYFDGDALLDEKDLRHALPSADANVVIREQVPHMQLLKLSAYDARPDGLIAVAMNGPPEGTPLELWQGRRFVRSVGSVAPSIDNALRFSPDGNEIAVWSQPTEDTRSLSVIDIRSGRTTKIALSDQRAFSWSPDGVWLAVSTGTEIAIYGTTRSEPIYRLPFGASAMAWR